MADRHMRDAHLARELKVSPSQIKRWKNDEQGAGPDNVRAMANVFDVSEAYLYGMDTADVREQLALEIARALGSPEADVVRAFGGLSESRRYQLAGRVIGWIEAEVSTPLPDRKSPVSIVRRDGDGAVDGANPPVANVANDGPRRPSKP
jgi:transcriptional regulator with XRE-family HTH domain